MCAVGSMATARRGENRSTSGPTSQSIPATGSRMEAIGSPCMYIGVCNRWAKNTTTGIDGGTADWLRDDGRLAARNTYGSFWDAANRGNRLVDAQRTVVIANRGVATTAAGH